jgi:Phage antirepressor protein KilAC domain.
MATKSATQMASLYGMKSSVAFNKLLVNCGLLIHTIKGYVLADSLRNLGLTAVEESPFFLPNGAKASKKRSVWTEKGQEYIHKQLSRLGIVPASEQRDLFGTTLNA